MNQAKDGEGKKLAEHGYKDIDLPIKVSTSKKYYRDDISIWWTI